MEEISYVKKNYINYIDGIIKNNKISHAYLIEVDNYDSDIEYIYSFIKMILCNISYDEITTSNNKIIDLIDSGNYPDLSVISSDSSVINKSLIKDLQREFSNTSMLEGKRIYIIKEADKMNEASSNTILKFLEEPEDNIIAFLVTNNRYRVLDTIISRCQILSLKENSYSYTIDDEFLDFVDCIINPNNFFIKYKSLVKDIFIDKIVVKDKLYQIENSILDYLNESSKKDYNADLKCLFDRKSSAELINIISIIEDEISKLEYNVNFKLWLDALFSKLIGG